MIVEFNRECESEKRYIVGFVIGEFLGLDVSCRLVNTKGIRLVDESSGKSLSLPSTFFDWAAKSWLSDSSLPGVRSDSDDGLVPILFPANKAAEFDVPFDILGTIFFLLSRYEEAVLPARDEHGRFPASESWLGRHQLLNRPLANEYIEVLWQAIKQVWPAARRREHEFKLVPSHDVDHPAKRWRRWKHTLRTTWQTARSGKLVAATRPLRNQLIYGVQSARRSWRNDPFDTISWLMDQSEDSGCKSVFNYIPKPTDATYDRGMPLDHPHVIDQWMRICNRRHEIGIHPGYNTSRDPIQFANSADVFSRHYRKFEWSQERLGGRQHYLKWDPLVTPGLWENAALDYDSTLGYSDQAGFRCGFCHEFPMYDLKNRCELKLRQVPLVAMDASVLADAYMGLGYTEQGMDCFIDLKQQCRKHHGLFTLLWHNNLLINDKQRSFYSQILKA